MVYTAYLWNFQSAMWVDAVVLYIEKTQVRGFVIRYNPHFSIHPHLTYSKMEHIGAPYMMADGSVYGSEKIQY
jgi:hypothetical protein